MTTSNTHYYVHQSDYSDMSEARPIGDIFDDLGKARECANSAGNDVFTTITDSWGQVVKYPHE